MNPKYKDVSTSELKEKLERKEIIKKLDEFESGFFKNLFNNIIKQTSVWIVSLLIAFISIFSDFFTLQIKTGLNKANIKSGEYEKIANNLSEYIFVAELIEDFYRNHSENSKYIKDRVEEYNVCITELRKTEYSHLALIKKYSGEEISTEYKNLISSVKTLDKSIHQLNPVGIIISRTHNDSLIRYTPKMISTIDSNIPSIKSNIKLLITNTETFLEKL